MRQVLFRYPVEPRYARGGYTSCDRCSSRCASPGGRQAKGVCRISSDSDWETPSISIERTQDFARRVLVEGHVCCGRDASGEVGPQHGLECLVAGFVRGQSGLEGPDELLHRCLVEQAGGAPVRVSADHSGGRVWCLVVDSAEG